MKIPALASDQLAALLGDRLPMTEAEYLAANAEYDELAAELEGSLVLRVRRCVRAATLRVVAAEQELREAQISLDNCLYARDREEVTNPLGGIKANRLATLARQLHAEALRRRDAITSDRPEIRRTSAK